MWNSMGTAVYRALCCEPWLRVGGGGDKLDESLSSDCGPSLESLGADFQ